MTINSCETCKIYRRWHLSCSVVKQILEFPTDNSSDSITVYVAGVCFRQSMIRPLYSSNLYSSLPHTRPNMPFFCCPFIEKQQGPVSFESVLLSSLCREQSMQAWCEQCSRYQPTVSVVKISVKKICWTNRSRKGFSYITGQQLFRLKFVERL